MVRFKIRAEKRNLEVSYQPLDQTSSVYVPHDDLLPDSRHGKLVLRRENDVVGVVELLADVSHSIWELQCNAPTGIFVCTSVCESGVVKCLCK